LIENISWASLCGVCTDGAPAMLGVKSGFQTLVKNKAPNLVTTHCFIHREALASKTLPDGLKCAFEVVVKSVNFIKYSALNTRLFRKLCEDLNSEHKQLLYYTKVRWLSRGNLVARVFELRDEIKIFLETEKPELAVHFENVKFLSCLAYLVDIFEVLNQLNLKMQGQGKDIIQFVDFARAFVEKLGNWKRKRQMVTLTCFIVSHVCLMWMMRLGMKWQTTLVLYKLNSNPTFQSLAEMLSHL